MASCACHGYHLVVPGSVATLNATYKVNRKGRFYKDAATKAWQERVHSVALGEKFRFQLPWFKPAVVTMTMWNMRADIDAAIKATLDALNGVAYKDDRDIKSLHVYVKSDDGDKRLEVQVETQG